ncbi:MAG: type II secretion system protein [candidate division Zixibacteria bacterium]|nr:type II secretion system protein [candidate division Zixibacteria bacterium]
MKKKAFTLIELLVVISIIAMLLAILMPSLSAVKKKATSAVCLANLRQMSTAWYLYAGDNDGRVVGGSTTRNSPYDEWSPGVPAYSWVLFPLNDSGSPVNERNSDVEQKINGIKAGLLYTYLENPKVYHCPGDKRYQTAPVKGGSGKGGYRTYSIVGGMNGVNPAGGWEIVPITVDSQIRQPSSKYVFVEEMDGRGCNAGSWVINPKSKGWVDPMGIWHGDSSTLGFADGHAELHKWREDSTVKMCEEQTFYAPLLPGEEGTDREYMLEHYPYKSLK